MPEKAQSITYKLTSKEKENLVTFLVNYSEDEKDKKNLRVFFQYIETLITHRDLTHDDFIYEQQLASATGQVTSED